MEGEVMYAHSLEAVVVVAGINLMMMAVMISMVETKLNTVKLILSASRTFLMGSFIPMVQTILYTQVHTRFPRG